MSGTPSIASRLLERLAFNADTTRALRVALAFGGSLALFHALHRPADAMLVAFTAQSIALQDLRGAYAMRVAILTVMALVAAGAVMLGVAVSGNAILAVLAMGLVATMSGVWRHLSADYGPPMAVSAALLFLLGTSPTITVHNPWHLGGMVLLGGLCTGVLHAVFWMFHPQYPLRHAVAETWIAASDLIAKIRVADGADPDAEPALAGHTAAALDAIAAGESNLRAALDRTFLILGAAEDGRQRDLVLHLEEMRREVVHFSMRVLAFHTALESLRDQPGFERNLPVIDSVLKSLGDAARSTAVTLITYRADNFAATEVRLHRCGRLIEVLDAQLATAAHDTASMQVRAALARVADCLPRIIRKLEETIGHGSVRSMFPTMLPELGTRSLQSLSAWINPDLHLDPVLIRYSARMAAVTMFAVALYQGFHIPRGYWIVFTIIVVLQPDYGSTRERAGQRIGGTLAGVVLGSALLWFHMPLVVIDLLASVASFFFAYFVKRRYGVGIFFVTLLVVLVSETMQKIGIEFAEWRLLCTLLGGGMALVAALWFWPVWEGEKFTALLASALRANTVFLDAMAPLFGLDSAVAATINPLMARRRAENANRFAAESLKRMTAEPSGWGTTAPTHETVNLAAGLATGCQRITRAFNAVAVHAGEHVTLRENSKIPGLTREIEAAIEALAVCVESGRSGESLAALSAALEKIDARLALVQVAPSRENPAALSQAGLIWTQFAKSIAEIRAMALMLGAPESLPAESATQR